MLRYYRASIALTLVLFVLSFLTTTVLATTYAKYNYTFYSVINETNESLGDVSIQFVDGSTQIVPVVANQTVSVLVTQDVSAVTVNGQTTAVGMITNISLPSGATSEIIVKNENTRIR